MSTASTKILFLAANPTSTSRLALDEEMRAIQAVLRQSPHPFELVSEWAVRSDELTTCLLRHRPQIVHFSGHGSKEGELLFVGREPDHVAPIPTEVLRQVFQGLGKDIFCVVLNACYTETQAKAIVESVPGAIGTSREVSDPVATAFAVGFYEALGYGKSLTAAHQLACTKVALTQFGSPFDLPGLQVKSGVDAAALFLQIAVTPAPSPQLAQKSRRPSRASLRQLLTEVLRTASDLDAFVLDYFPAVHGEFSAGMPRDARRSLLLESVKPDLILSKLRHSKPKQVAEHESELEWEE